MRFRNRINNKNKGFTLIELLVSFAILSVVMVMTVSIQASGIRIFARGNQLAKDQNSSRLASDFITEQVRFARSLEILTSVPSPEVGYNDIYLSNGDILFYKNGQLESAVALNSESNFTLEFRKNSERLLEFSIGKNDGEHYDITTMVAVLNIATTLPYEISGSDTGIGVRYTLNHLNDQQKLELDSAAIIILNQDYITEDITLPLLGSYGSVITWHSSLPQNISADGEVNREESQEITVFLTATITHGDLEPVTKTFELKVIPLNAPVIESVQDISHTVIEGDVYTMPKKATAVLTDDSTMLVDVTWNPSNIDTSTAGVFTSIGSVEGYSGNVTLTVTVNEGVSNLIPFENLAVGDYVRVYTIDDHFYDFQKISDNRLLIRWVDSSTYTWSEAGAFALGFENRFSSSVVSSSDLLTQNETDSLNDYKDSILKNTYNWWLKSQQNANSGHYITIDGASQQASKTNLYQSRPYIVLLSGQSVSGGDGSQGTPYILYRGQ